MSVRRNNYIRVPVHFVWATHERMPLLPDDGEDERKLWRYIEALAQQKRCDVLAIGGMPDHIHLLVNLHNTISMAELMKFVKGSSSRFVSQELRRGGWFNWQNHYGAKAVCPDALDTCIRYIANQKQHHADGTTDNEWERVYTEHDLPDTPEDP